VLIQGRERKAGGKTSRILAIGLAGLAAMACWGGFARGLWTSEAGTALRMDVSELVGRADLIVEGHVLSTRAVEDAGGRIETELDLSVDRTHLGDDRGERRLRLPGGVLADGRGMIVPGLPVPVAGDEVLLILSEGTASDLRVPIGLSQGSFRLLRDTSGKRVGVRDGGGLRLATAGGARLIEVDGIQVMDYAELRAEIEVGLVKRRLRPAVRESGR
jgi:hypothetical protein